MKNVFDVVLLNALPASGKSEVRKFMNENNPEQMTKDYHIGKNLQLDDFPYVFAMREIDNALSAMGMDRLYYPSDEDPFFDGRAWGALSVLLSEDYHDLVNRNYVKPASCAEYLFERIDRACMTVGMKPMLSLLDQGVRSKIANKIEDRCKAMLDEKQSQYCEDLSDKTIIIEFARGGNDGAGMPLTGTFGYQYTYANLSADLLENAAILYIWVEPEESRRKNEARYDPNDPGSSIAHMTPLKVMMYDYGCDDIVYLRDHSDKPDTVCVEAYGKKFYLPIGIYDNRIDRTTQFRGDKSTWDEKLVKETEAALIDATSRMWSNYKK